MSSGQGYMSVPDVRSLRDSLSSAMARLSLVLLVVAAACSKSAGNQDKISSPPAPSSGGDVIAVPQPGQGPSMGRAQPETPPAPAGKDDDRFKLRPEEGKLAIEAPADAKAGSEAIAKVIVTPGKGYHVNTDYPVKLTLTSPAGVTLAKAEYLAGGSAKGKGDADVLDENQLAIAVKLTAAQSGSYTINGNFKFAVCDKDQCLAKKETIAIAVAAK
jgi:hypothetical protein